MLGAGGKIERVGVQPLIKTALALPSQPRSAKSIISTPLQLRLDKPLLACQSSLSLPPHSRSSNTTLSRPAFFTKHCACALESFPFFPSSSHAYRHTTLACRILFQLIITQYPHNHHNGLRKLALHTKAHHGHFHGRHRHRPQKVSACCAHACPRSRSWTYWDCL